MKIIFPPSPFLLRFLAGIICVGYVLIALVLSARTMSTVPLHDFDEANRAEGARQMALHKQYLFPVTGAPFLRVEELAVPYAEAEHLRVFHHLERPPLVYWAMIASTMVLGESEFAYRLPSLLFGLAGLILFAFFARCITEKTALPAVALGFVIYAASFDWWLSSQSAMLDTALSTFLLIAVGSLLLAVRTKQRRWSVLSGIGLAGAILSKGQPAAVFLVPYFTALFLGVFSMRQAILLAVTTLFVIVPWLLPAITTFGLRRVFDIFILGFAAARFAEADATQQAPVYWYARWWFDTFRPGFPMFLSLLLFDLRKRVIDPYRVILGLYILAGFVLFSFAENKVWWYVMPLIPAVSLYVAYSSRELLKKSGLFGAALSAAMAVSSIPLAFRGSSTLASRLEPRQFLPVLRCLRLRLV